MIGLLQQQMAGAPVATTIEDEFDMETQRRLEEEIRTENVNRQLSNAMEFAPEVFGQVFMLYINCEVNGQKVKAFVDSGAQMTIMNPAFAEKCGYPLLSLLFVYALTCVLAQSVKLYRQTLDGHGHGCGFRQDPRSCAHGPTQDRVNVPARVLYDH